MWHLLKGHHHLQDEFSVFFDHLRPAASRMGDFEEINWTEEKEYEFDGFEEVALPDVEEEEEPPKTPAAPKSKRRKETGAPTHDKVHGSLVASSFHESRLEPLPKCLSALGWRQASFPRLLQASEPEGAKCSRCRVQKDLFPVFLAQLFLLPLGLHVCLCVHVKK